MWSTPTQAWDWIAERLGPFATSVTSVVPAGFTAYARILHPAEEPRPATAWCAGRRWPDGAASSPDAQVPHHCAARGSPRGHRRPGEARGPHTAASSWPTRRRSPRSCDATPPLREVLLRAAGRLRLGRRLPASWPAPRPEPNRRPPWAAPAAFRRGRPLAREGRKLASASRGQQAVSTVRGCHAAWQYARRCQRRRHRPRGMRLRWRRARRDRPCPKWRGPDWR